MLRPPLGWSDHFEAALAALFSGEGAYHRPALRPGGIERTDSIVTFTSSCARNSPDAPSSMRFVALTDRSRIRRVYWKPGAHRAGLAAPAFPELGDATRAEERGFCSDLLTRPIVHSETRSSVSC